MLQRNNKFHLATVPEIKWIKIVFTLRETNGLKTKGVQRCFPNMPGKYRQPYPERSVYQKCQTSKSARLPFSCTDSIYPFKDTALSALDIIVSYRKINSSAYRLFPLQLSVLFNILRTFLFKQVLTIFHWNKWNTGLAFVFIQYLIVPTADSLLSFKECNDF
jgi:hypothetical protein